MDGELERYHKTNSGLDLLISNLKLKQTGLSGEVTLQRRSRTDLEALIKRMQHDLQQVRILQLEEGSFFGRASQLKLLPCTDMVHMTLFLCIPRPIPSPKYIYINVLGSVFYICLQFLLACTPKLVELCTLSVFVCLHACGMLVRACLFQIPWGVGSI
eukprot:1140244-Pelagomonas_calceolata.AAC.8